MSSSSESEASIPSAARLEKVRERRSVPTVRDFIEKLNERDGFEVKYDTARRYHRDRTASADYFAQVSEVFGVSLRWLITGKGQMDEEESRERERRKGRVGLGGERSVVEGAIDAIAEEYRPVLHANVESLAPILSAYWTILEAHAEDRGTSIDELEPEFAEDEARRVGLVLAMPFRMLGIRREEKGRFLLRLGGWNEEVYLQAMGQALTLLAGWKAQQVRSDTPEGRADVADALQELLDEQPGESDA